MSPKPGITLSPPSVILTYTGSSHPSAKSHVSFPLLMWFQRICLGPRLYIPFHNMLHFYGEESLDPHSTQARGPPLVNCPWLLIQYICSYPSYLETIFSICWGHTMPQQQIPIYHGVNAIIWWKSDIRGFLRNLMIYASQFLDFKTSTTFFYLCVLSESNWDSIVLGILVMKYMKQPASITKSLPSQCHCKEVCTP
jgi:hypothetical protein